MNEQKKKSKAIIILLLLVFAIVVILGLIIYNTPSNRLSRQLDLGEKYLDEQNYEQAVVAFDKAIAIDPMSERAYIGKAGAYVGMGDYEQAAATYTTAVQTISDGNEVWNAAEQFYLDYAQSYIDDGDLESAVDVLKEGDDLLGSDRLKDKVEEVRARQEEQEQEQEVELWEARVQGFLQQIYGQMAAGNYMEAILAFYSFFTLEERQETLLLQEKYLHFPNSDMSGTGIGLYSSLNKVHDQYHWYIYYGDYVNGEREGNGVYIEGGSNSENIFTCEWSHDVPNGYGEWEQRFWDEQTGATTVERRFEGNFKDGLLDGTGYSYYQDDSPNEYEHTFSASEGIPEDRTEEYLSLYPEFRDYYSGADRYVYSYCEDTVPSPGSLGNHVFDIFPGETIGVPRFADVEVSLLISPGIMKENNQ